MCPAIEKSLGNTVESQENRAGAAGRRGARRVPGRCAEGDCRTDAARQRESVRGNQRHIGRRDQFGRAREQGTPFPGRRCRTGAGLGPFPLRPGLSHRQSDDAEEQPALAAAIVLGGTLVRSRNRCSTMRRCGRCSSRNVRFPRIEHAIEQGYLDAVSVTAAGYSSAHSTSFFRPRSSTRSGHARVASACAAVSISIT